MIFDFSHLSLPRNGEVVSGDAVHVRQRGTWALFAVIDVLGHGPEASVVAKLAVDALDSVPEDQSVPEIIWTLHQALRHTRGAAAMICRRWGSELEGCGVGNVMLRAEGAALPVMCTPGVLGVRLRKPRLFSGKLEAGARLVIFSDGIISRFPLHALRQQSGSEVCAYLLNDFRRPHDDATVLVADLEETSAD